MSPETERFEINFHLAESARQFLVALRQQLDRESPSDPLAAFSISWGYEYDTTGKPLGENVYVGGYTRSEAKDVKSAIQTVAGIDLVYFVTAKEYAIFGGRVLAYSKARGLHLE